MLGWEVAFGSLGACGVGREAGSAARARPRLLPCCSNAQTAVVSALGTVLSDVGAFPGARNKNIDAYARQSLSPCLSLSLCFFSLVPLLFLFCSLSLSVFMPFM